MLLISVLFFQLLKLLCISYRAGLVLMNLKKLFKKIFTLPLFLNKSLPGQSLFGWQFLFSALCVYHLNLSWSVRFLLISLLAALSRSPCMWWIVFCLWSSLFDFWELDYNVLVKISYLNLFGDFRILCTWMATSFPRYGKVSTTIALNEVFYPIFPVFSFWDSHKVDMCLFGFFPMVPYHSFRLSLLFFILISLFSSDSAYPDRSSSSQILSSAWWSLLLKLPIGFFIYSLYSQAPEYLVHYYFFVKLFILLLCIFMVIELSILNLTKHS